MDTSKRNILIVGHSSGIGEAIRKTLVADYRVYGTYRHHEVPDTHPNLSSHPLEIGEDEVNVDFLPDTLHGLVYCPGAINLKPFARIKPEEFLADYQMQVVGAVKMIQACLPRLKQSGNASVVLFSTVAVQTGFNFHSLVSSSKGALEGLTRALSAELAPTIRVNAIAPSITQTPLAQTLLNTEDKIQSNASRHPLKRIGQAQDIASMAAFLLGEQSGWITGQIFHVDGGMSAIRM
jgi:NAD(P)-dependent dehydrogenase (short-subunit alcohol dehydrogenase family)